MGMGKTITLRDLFGRIKDKASLSKAALLSKPNSLSIRLAVLRATAHSPPAPPDDRHLSAILLFGETSRSTASPIIAALMDRLHRTGNSTVALKCLIVIHVIIRRGPFILQDQLSIFPASGGYNYLNLSDFRDGASAATWALSSWVRWYGRFLETILSSSRVLGYFLCSSSSTMVKENKEHRISSFLNSDLIKELDSLVVVIEEICKSPDNLVPEGDMISQTASEGREKTSAFGPKRGPALASCRCGFFSDHGVDNPCILHRGISMLGRYRFGEELLPMHTQ